MDAATLYVTLTLANGNQRTTIAKFRTMEACEWYVEQLRKDEGPADHRPITTFVCEGHNPFVFIAGYGRTRRYRAFPTRQGCNAVRWITYLRDRGPGKLGDRFEDPPSYRHSWRE